MQSDCEGQKTSRNCNKMYPNNGSWEELEQFVSPEEWGSHQNKIIHFDVNQNVLIQNSSKTVLSQKKKKQPHDDTQLLISVLHEPRKHSNRRARKIATILAHTQALPFEK